HQAPGTQEIIPHFSSPNPSSAAQSRRHLHPRWPPVPSSRRCPAQLEGRLRHHTIDATLSPLHHHDDALRHQTLPRRRFSPPLQRPLLSAATTAPLRHLSVTADEGSPRQHAVANCKVLSSTRVCEIKGGPKKQLHRAQGHLVMQMKGGPKKTPARRVSELPVPLHLLDLQTHRKELPSLMQVWHQVKSMCLM
ncbi:unnamed protein product, partial [Urochloa humidicola]